MSEALSCATSSTWISANSNLVARIDLTEWKTKGFFASLYHLQQGPGRSQVGDFFMDPLGPGGHGCQDPEQGAAAGGDDYCDSRQLEPAERNDYKKQVFKYCNIAGQRRRGDRDQGAGRRIAR